MKTETYPRMTPAIGRAMWALLDAMAESYPEEPTAADQRALRRSLNEFDLLLAALGGECPCHGQWRRMLDVTGFPLQSRSVFRRWVVAAHDWVNAKLERPLWDEASRSHPIFLLLAPRMMPVEPLLGEPAVIAPECGGCGNTPVRRL